MDFDSSFKKLIGHEGNFTQDPRDRGNWTSGVIGIGQLKGTKYGISAMTYPDIDIKNITLAQAKAIYKRDFWERMCLADLPDILAFQMFDAAVNSGVGNSIRFFQRAVNVADDGWVGEITLTAAKKYDAEALVGRFNGVRLRFMTQLSTFKTYGRGWSRRVADNLCVEEYK